MRNPRKSTQEEQDEAFFGDTTGTTTFTSNRNNPNQHYYDNDERLAQQLQNQFIQESRKKNDFESERKKKQQERLDMEFAKRLQNEQEQSGLNNSGSSQSRRGRYSRRSDDNSRHMDQRKRQEEEDAKMAKALQEEEEGLGSTQPSGFMRMGRGSFSSNSSSSARRNGNSRISGISDNHTINALIPKCATCKKIVTFGINALGNLYHRECFRCMACHEVFNENESFAVATGEDGQSYPLHKQCYSEIYGLKCTVCRKTIEGDSNGRVSYVKHPFFEEIMCSSHSGQQRKCTGCHRYEPMDSNRRFVDLDIANNRCVCHSCCRTVIVDSNDAKPLWNRVIRFFEQGLKLPVFTGMSDIPVLIVPHDALNDQLQNTNHHQGSSQIMTRGLCLSEHQIGLNFMLPRLRFDTGIGSFLPSDPESRGHTYFRVPDASKVNPQTNVTAILCLNGLPADLSASILAHEATHAWIKLHPNFDPSRPIPPQVEEGCCQLVAMLFLNDGLDKPTRPSSSSVDNDGPSDEKLRQYFKFSIETDTSEVYGGGYRKAAKAYAQIGIEALLSHVVNYRDFPNI